MMKIGRWEGNEIIYTIDVVDNSVNLIEDFDFAFDIIGANAIMTGMVVAEAAIPDMTIQISAGIAKDFTVGTFLVGEALVDTVTDSEPVLDRRDNVEIRRIIEDTTLGTRQFKDPVTENITESIIDTKSEYKTEIQIVVGTPGASPTAPATTTGWIKIAEILVPAASLTVIDANIYNVDAEKAGVNNTSWTADATGNYRNGSISEMKTKIIDNEADIATNTPAIGLNTTHRGSDGKDHSDVVLNNTHRSSDGSDHTFIDQDVKAVATPEFAGLTLGGGDTIKKLTISTSNPSGGADGDIWFVREA